MDEDLDLCLGVSGTLATLEGETGRWNLLLLNCHLAVFSKSVDRRLGSMRMRDAMP